MNKKSTKPAHKEDASTELLSEWDHIFDSLSDAIFIVDDKQIVRKVNRASLNLLKIKKQNIIGKKCFSVFHHAHDSIPECKFKDCLSAKKIRALKFRNAKTGKLYSVQLRPLLDNAKNPVGCLHILKRQIEKKEETKKKKVYLQTKKLLEQSEEQYRTLASNSVDIIWKLNKKLEFTYLSPASLPILGYKPSYMVGKPLHQFSDSVNFAKISFYAMRTMMHPKKYPHAIFEIKIRHKKGHMVDFEIIGKALLDKKGHFQEFQGTSRDITERKKAEEDRMKLISMHELSNDLVGYSDFITKKVQYINAAGKRMLGLKVQENVLNLKTSDIFTPASFKFLKKEAVPMAISKGIWKGEASFSNKNGKEIPASMVLMAHKDSTGKVVAMSTVSRDITQERLASLMLKESEKKYRNLIENANDGICIIEDGIINYVNPQHTALIGYSKKEVIGQTLTRFIYSGEVEKVSKKYKRILSGKENPQNYDTILVHKNGKLVHVNIRAAVLSDNKVKKTFVFIRDITDIKKAQEELIRSEKMSTLGDLSASLAHELNSPLMGILNLVESYKDEEKKESERFNEYSEIIKAIYYMSNIIKNVKGLAKKEIKYTKKKVNLNTLVNGLIFLVTHKLKRTQAMLKKDYDENLWPIHGNADSLSQVFLNILNNACNSLNRGGTINLTTKNIKNKNQVCVKIHNTGSYIPKEDFERIFEPYYSTKLNGEGLGLGLYISKKIIEEHNGSIHVLSNKKRGTTFIVCFPQKGHTK